ncbi:DUF3459 domain-containing protein [Litorihabitans aurantiacus]|uniref:DUF3459 domain-containing protein n=1 Tax=Litorihabitans aurantiacus TaxID=1930061 RepID=A0AA38CNP4_9MICO|nr:hypothetical protein GCM10025875_13950 [Litorihabitans aurantiacus]
MQAAAAALVLLSPFTPMIFMGEEWAATSPFQFFTDHPEPELGEAVSRGRASEFGTHGWDEDVVVPDPQDRETFLRSRLRWDEVDEPEHARMLAWHRDLIALRRTQPALQTHRRDHVSVEVGTDAEGGDAWVALHRRDAGAVGPGVTTVVNLRETGTTVPIRSVASLLEWDGGGRTVRTPDEVVLPPRSVVVLSTAS